MAETTKLKIMKVPVVTAYQNNYRLAVGFIQAKQLLEFTAIEHYDPKKSPTDEDQGYQRPPERGRITPLGNYIVGQNGNLLMPTSIVLSARGSLNYNAGDSTITLTKDNPLYTVDGQHRIEGFRYAYIEKKVHEIGDFPIPFVAFESNDKVEEMNQFRTINGTAKQVRTDLVNMILTAVYSNEERSDVPIKDQSRIVISNVVDKLAKESSSPWLNKIILPGEVNVKDSNKIIRATSFITSLKPVYVWLKDVIMDVGHKSLEEEVAFMCDIVSNFWQALEEVVPEPFEQPQDYVLQKTPGIFSLHKLLKYLLGDMYKGRREFSKDVFVEFLSDYRYITHAPYWAVESRQASVYGSMKGFEDLFREILESVERVK
jgi:DGQHR domain-containing protein